MALAGMIIFAFFRRRHRASADIGKPPFFDLSQVRLQENCARLCRRRT
jgi:hypothetical protein